MAFICRIGEGFIKISVEFKSMSSFGMGISAHKAKISIFSINLQQVELRKLIKLIYL